MNQKLPVRIVVVHNNNSVWLHRRPYWKLNTYRCMYYKDSDAKLYDEINFHGTPGATNVLNVMAAVWSVERCSVGVETLVCCFNVL